MVVYLVDSGFLPSVRCSVSRSVIISNLIFTGTLSSCISIGLILHYIYSLYIISINLAL